jgi:DedD protein
MFGQYESRERRMASSQDTEITLGTGKMLVLFFALAALCAVFFGMGYKLGKSSSVTAAETVAPTNTAASPNSPAAAVKPAASSSPTSSDLAYYQAKETEKTAADTSATSSTPAAATPSAAVPASTSSPLDSALASGSAGYFVQVAAVSKQEDANALVDALKRKEYPAFVSPGPDNLFHVQVGPFADVKNAEDMRARLVNDGYNPILKK